MASSSATATGSLSVVCQLSKGKPSHDNFNKLGSSKAIPNLSKLKGLREYQISFMVYSLFCHYRITSGNHCSFLSKCQTTVYERSHIRGTLQRIMLSSLWLFFYWSVAVFRALVSLTKVTPHLACLVFAMMLRSFKHSYRFQNFPFRPVSAEYATVHEKQTKHVQYSNMQRELTTKNNNKRNTNYTRQVAGLNLQYLWI